MIARQQLYSRVWKPAPLLEKLESKVDHQLKFGEQNDHLGLGYVPGRYVNSHLVTTPDRKAKIIETLCTSLLDAYHLKDIDKAMQGCYLRFKDTLPFDLSWRHLIGTNNPRLIKWVLNASINSVVTPDLRKLWELTPSAACPICDHK